MARRRRPSRREGFFLAVSGPSFIRGIYLVHGVNVKRNPVGRDLNLLKKQ
jgi:hypothetical protein